jgi:hypothetical protein
LHLFQCRAQRSVNQGARVCADIGPQVNVDHQGAGALQRRDQVLAQEGGFAGSAQAREEQAAAKALVEHAGAQQLCGHVVREVGAVVDGTHGQVIQNR